jgi:hypothetical protein
MATHSLSNIENYKDSGGESSCVAFSRFLHAAGEYLVQCVDSIHVRNVEYYRYVVSQGLRTLSHVFKTLYLYTNNLPLTSFHCQKAIYYYIEFIGQIGDDNHGFLQLTSNDAMLFVYKKTLFEIDSAFRRDFACVRTPGSPRANLDLLISIFLRCSETSLGEVDLAPDDKNQVLTTHKTRVDSLATALVNLSARGEEEFARNLELVDAFCAKGRAPDPQSVEAFCRRLRRRPTTLAQLHQRLRAVEARGSASRCDCTPAKLAQLLLPS